MNLYKKKDTQNDKVIEKTIEKIVEKIVEVDNPLMI